MRRRAKRRDDLSQRRRPSLRARIARFVRALFSSGRSRGEWGEEREGGLGVREPRRPLHPSLGGAAALESPPEETRDVWAVGDEESR